MPVQLYANALTTHSRVKARLDITVSTFDTLFITLINSATDMIESMCNRRFLRQTYTDQVYSVRAQSMQYISLEQIPVTTLSSLSYRAGTPSSPSWTAFTTDEYELVEDGKSGLVRVYAVAPYGVNAVKATYTAGYLIDFANYGNTTLHTLPADLTEMCERMVVKAFKKRPHEGKSTESFDGSTVTWQKEMDDDMKMILAKYQKLPAFV